MASAKKCDRCGKYYDIGDYGTDKCGSFVTGVGFKRQANETYTCYTDLCKDCIGDLKAFLTDTDQAVYQADGRIAKALEIAWRHGQNDGAHHKAWVIDQLVHALFYTEEDYTRWVSLYENGGEYEWDVGIAP